MKLLLRCCLLAGEQHVADVFAATFTVTNTNVSGPGSLQQALWDANTNAGPDLVHFNISGDGPHVIAPTIAQPLPPLTNTVTIDGYTQPGSSPNTLTNGNNAVLKIQLHGLNAGSVDGLGIADWRWYRRQLRVGPSWNARSPPPTPPVTYGNEGHIARHSASDA